MYANFGALGQSTGQSYYNRAVSALANYNNLFARANNVADKTIRANLLAQFSTANVQDTPAYYAETVKEYVDQANSFVPTNYDVFTSTTRPIHRLESLEGVLGTLAPAVAQAEQQAGVLPGAPAPQVVTKTVTQTVTQPVEAQFLGMPTSTWLYIVGGTAAVAVIGVIVMAAAKKKKAPGVAGLG